MFLIRDDKFIKISNKNKGYDYKFQSHPFKFLLKQVIQNMRKPVPGI